MSNCARLMMAHARVAREYDRDRSGLGLGFTYAHYLAAHLAAKLISGEYTA